MNFQQLEYIVAVDAHRHFVKAAEHCFITQATLSMMIKKLEDELAERDVKFYFEIQQFKDAATTPIEDATVSWGGDESFIAIAELVIPQESENEKEVVDAIAFSPWNIDETYFKPLGSMNRSRRKVYAASMSERMKKQS